MIHLVHLSEGVINIVKHGTQSKALHIIAGTLGWCVVLTDRVLFMIDHDVTTGVTVCLTRITATGLLKHAPCCIFHGLHIDEYVHAYAEEQQPVSLTQAGYSLTGYSTVYQSYVVPEQ